MPAAAAAAQAIGHNTVMAADDRTMRRWSEAHRRCAARPRIAWQDECMGQGFGIESHGAHHNGPHRAAARYLVVIDTAGESLARLFDAARDQVAEFDASTGEVAVMTRGLAPQRSAASTEWDQALGSHNAAERAAAEVYTLDV